MRWIVAIGLAGALVSASSARAGVYSDDLAKCLVSKTNNQDRGALVNWIFAAISSHPQLRLQSNLESRQIEDASRVAARLFQRLMTEDCRRETVAGIKYEGSGAIENAFRVLGEVAMRSIMEEPSVAKGVGQIGEFVDAKKFEALMSEAGVGRAN